MRVQAGDFTRHPKALEWGTGFVHRLDSDNVLHVFFSRVGEKKLQLDRLPCELERIPASKEIALIYHRERIEARGRTYQGVRAAGLHGRRRTPNCYRCKQELDNAYNVECVECGWILCQCTACGCEYHR